jgi:type I restriction enzyme S subunit
MMTWRIATIDEIKAREPYALVGGPFGSELTTNDYVEYGVPVIRGSNLPLDQPFSDADFVFVSESKAKALRANTAYPGDVVFTQRGTLGQVGLIPQDSRFQRYIISQSQMKLTVDPAKADARFVYYFFRQTATVHNIVNHTSTSGVPHINLGVLKQFEIPLPPVQIQHAIVDVLAAYDDLVAINERRLALCEEAARQIHREWFMRLRFPGHEHTPVINDAPLDWEVKPLFETATPTYGFAFKSEQFNEDGEGLPLVRIRDVLSGESKTFTAEEGPSDRQVSNGDVLIGMDGDFHMGLWAGGEAWLNQRVVKITSLGEIADYLLFWMMAEPIRQLSATITGTTVAHLGAKELRSIRLLVPSSAVLTHANEVFANLGALIVKLKLVNARLRAARDLLLPRLMSGELAV